MLAILLLIRPLRILRSISFADPPPSNSLPPGEGEGVISPLHFEDRASVQISAGEVEEVFYHSASYNDPVTSNSLSSDDFPWHR